MGARHKLNGIMLKGSVVTAAVIGVISGSWAVFWTALAIGVIAALVSGDIRLKGDKLR